MIQRIQSLYLLLGALALSGLWFFNSLWQASAAAEAFPLFTFAVAALDVAAALLALGTILRYNARHQQRKLILVAQGLTVLLLLVLCGGLFWTGELSVRVRGVVVWNRVIGLALPVVSYGLLYLARRGVERDIKKVEDMDRFRLRDS